MPKKSTGYRTPLYRPPSPRKPYPFKLKIGKEEKIPPYGTPPADWTGSLAEWAVHWALTSLKEEFIYQYPFAGGRLTLGGTVVDFFLPSRLLIIRVQGVYWHYERGEVVVNADQFIKALLEGKGYTVIDILDIDALRDPLYYVKEALLYRDHSPASRGL